MRPIYIDIHIHTSENPNIINNDYDVDLLLSKIKQISINDDFLISLTDHNIINKKAYLSLINRTPNVLLGVELHISYSSDKPPYHCHIIFGVVEINNEVIDEINGRLLSLYPQKIITSETPNIPTIEEIINTFDDFEFVMLPHGGQSHRTFDTAVPREKEFDSTIERSIYYNQFDGFTARDNRGLTGTIHYLKKLGINEFVNLITCTDNYNPHIYPNAKAADAGPFIPTWLLSEPNFEGLRLALSEADRFIYSEIKPIIEYEHIEKVFINNEFLDIDVKLKKGLNVIIGGSSSGKTLFADSVYRTILGDFSDSNYAYLGVSELTVHNPSRIKPHYISQNYIVGLLNENSGNSGIENINIIKNVFPEDRRVKEKVRIELDKLKRDLEILVESVEKIEELSAKINRVPVFSRLYLETELENNLIAMLLPSENSKLLLDIPENFIDLKLESLNELSEYMRNSPLASNIDAEVDSIRTKVLAMTEKSLFEQTVRTIINKHRDEFDSVLANRNAQLQVKRNSFDGLIVLLNEYSENKNMFVNALKRIRKYKYKVDSKTVTSMGHILQIENSFELNEDKFIEIVNGFLKAEVRIRNLDEIKPENLFKGKFSQRPRVDGYEDFKNKIFSKFGSLDKRKYKITTSEGKDFDNLSAGWKTSVLLDLILGYNADFAPLIIDQPEDNLATEYINTGLINAIKMVKKNKQIILVSHNATIPMLGDAQNIILCDNNSGKIVIRNSVLEGKINDISMVDYIAKITDGGKASIKKRVKKYNLKRFRG